MQVVKKLQEFYTLFNADPSDNIKGVYNQSGEHSQLTLDYGNDCTTLAEPYLNKCGYDAAGNLLQHIDGFLTLALPITTKLERALVI